MVFTVSVAFTQITLTSANNPSAGDIDAYSICDTVNISQGNSGANQNWNFSNLTIQDTTTVFFVSPGSTPYSAQFPTSNIASTNDQINFNFMTTSGTGININGNAGPGLTVSYSNPQLFLQYPFSYNTTLNDNFAAFFSTGGDDIFRTGTTTITGDAWGIITLPSGTFTNSIRVKYVINTKDSSSTGIVLNTILTSYNWFIPGRKFPVFEIIYTSIQFNGFPFGGSKVVNYSPNNSIGISEVSSIIPENYNLSQNYPNPFNPETNLEFKIAKAGFVSLKIYGELGNEISTLVSENLNPGTYKYNFNAADLTSGIYFYTLNVNGFKKTRKMLLIK